MSYLINAILPSKKLIERGNISKKIEASSNLNLQLDKADKQSRISQNYRIAGLVLKVAEETALALQDCRYTAFDALVKNFGCQITALEVYQLVQDKSLIDESNSMLKMLPKLQRELKAKQASISPNTAKQDFNYSSLMQNTVPVLASFTVSKKMARLLRFRLLAIVNGNMLRNNQEVPITKYDPIQNILKDQQFNITRDLIDGLQAQEARRAIRYIKEQVEKIDSSCPRKEFLREACQTVKEKNKTPENRTPIPMMSLLYNMEVCMRRVERGIILVKNKIKLVGRPIQGAQPCHVYITMPEKRILTPMEVEELKDDTPLFVIEGYSKTNSLAAKIQKLGLMKLVRINSSDPSIQFSGCDNNQLNETFEAERSRLDKYRQKVISKIFEIDHVFCSSMAQERSEFRSSLLTANSNFASQSSLPESAREEFSEFYCEAG